MLATIFGIVLCIVCTLLVLVILLQKGRGGGLSGAFGGAGGHTPFGAKTGDVFTWVTVGFAVVFLVLEVVLNFIFVPQRYKGINIRQTPPPIKAPAEQSKATKAKPVKAKSANGAIGKSATSKPAGK